MLLLLPGLAAGPIEVLYGGNGGHPNPDGTPLSINNGWLISIDQTSGAVTPIGHPAGVPRLSGIAFLNNGVLYGSTIGGNSCMPNCPFPGPPLTPNTSTLIKINPDTGATVANIGPITAGAGGPAIAISDLAIQPGSGVLFGIEAVDPALSTGPAGLLYTINTHTGVATLIGGLAGVHNGSLAFAPNGTLYVAGTDFDSSGNFFNERILTVDPATANTLTEVAAANFYASLGFRASDGMLLGGDGDFGDIFTIDPTTGQELSHINTGLNFVGDLDFRPTPEPASLTLCGLGLLMIALRRRSRN